MIIKFRIIYGYKFALGVWRAAYSDSGRAVFFRVKITAPASAVKGARFTTLRLWELLLAPSIRVGFPTRKRMEAETGGESSGEALCQRTLLSITQYKEDIENRGYKDARLIPFEKMTREEIKQWYNFNDSA